MKRRAFVAGMAAVMAALRISEGQHAPRPYRIGYISPGKPDITTVESS